MDDAPLITKYRPTSWDEFIGNESLIASLQRAMTSSSPPHAFLFTGPSGIGKTTAARIVGSMLEADVTEIDAASNSGVDAMRGLVEFGQHQAFSDSGRRLIIIDEAHALSKSAWQAALKLLEEPPRHLYIALCTTELDKVPDTIATRCFHAPLRAVRATEMEDYLAAICDLEAFEVQQDVFALVVQTATGQPRKALSLLQAVHDAPSKDEARRIIARQEAGEPLIELLQYLLSGKRSWAVIGPTLQRIDADAFESAALLAGRYISAALLRAENEQKAQKIWSLLEALMFPAATWDRKTAFMAAVGRMVWGA